MSVNQQSGRGIDRSDEEANLAKVQAMTTEEREEESKEIIDRFGPGVVEVMKRRRQAREQGRPPAEEAEAGPSRLPLDRKAEVTRLRDEVNEENWSRVMVMGEADREEERKELEERFGAKVMGALRRRAEQRATAPHDPGRQFWSDSEE